MAAPKKAKGLGKGLDAQAYMEFADEFLENERGL